MDGVDRAVRRPSLKERLGLKGFSCCGPTWGTGPTTVNAMDSDQEEDTGGQLTLSPQTLAVIAAQDPVENRATTPCAVRSQPTTGINLAAALAAERHLRAGVDSESGGRVTVGPSPASPHRNGERIPTMVDGRTPPATPAKVSLMRLLLEADGCEYDEIKKEEDGGVCDSVCCVCMGRKKAAAFIPCGHTFCRLCSRELWLNRGSCPLCNRPIFEILDIY